MLICQIAVLSHQFQEGSERAWAFGWWGIIFGIGLGFGPIIGGTIAALLSWEWVFLIHVPLAAIALLLAANGVQEFRDRNVKMLYGGLSVWLLAAISFCVFPSRASRPSCLAQEASQT